MTRLPPESRYPKADLLHRAVGRFADLVLAVLADRLLPGVGGLVAIAYLVLADGIFLGQSPGKRLAGIKVVHRPTGLGARYRESLLRNWPFGLLALFYYVPVIGWLLLPLGTLLVFGFEGYMAWTDRLGLRIGDVLADTQVVDASVPIEAPALRDGATRLRSRMPEGEPASARVGDA